MTCVHETLEVAQVRQMYNLDGLYINPPGDSRRIWSHNQCSYRAYRHIRSI